MNKIYLLLMIDDCRDIDLEEYSKTGHETPNEINFIKGWILNEEVAI